MSAVWVVTASDGWTNEPDEFFDDERAAEARATELVNARRFRFVTFYQSNISTEGDAA